MIHALIDLIPGCSSDPFRDTRTYLYEELSPMLMESAMHDFLVPNCRPDLTQLRDPEQALSALDFP